MSSYITYIRKLDDIPIYYVAAIILAGIISYLYSKSNESIGIIIPAVVFYIIGFSLLYHKMLTIRKNQNQTINNDDTKKISKDAFVFFICGLIYGIVKYACSQFLVNIPPTKLIALLYISPLGAIIPIIYSLITLIIIQASY